MKEVLTKRFWQDVKKTFEDARDNPAPEEKDKAAVEDAPPAKSDDAAPESKP